MTNFTMQWARLLSTTRFKVDNDHVVPIISQAGCDDISPVRSDFHIDHDRVAFSGAFRCLGRKTQVHPLAQHDHTHNRLTHSVEVASVGRSLGNQVGAMLLKAGELPEGFVPFDIGDLVQVACLAHDIGNPPFGHTGEAALRDWFRHPNNRVWLQKLNHSQRQDICTYEGNAHSLRILVSLEMYAGLGGMRLTAAAIGTVVKYPWTVNAIPSHMGEKFNIYGTELAYFQCIAKDLGLLQNGPNNWCRHPLSYLIEAADDICYAILDLEDAVAIHILEAEDFENVLAPLIKDSHARLLQTKNLYQRCAMLRSIVMGHCIDEITHCFMDKRHQILAGHLAEKDLVSICRDEVRSVLVNAKALANQHIYHHHSKLRNEIAAFACLGSLLDVFIPAIYNRIASDKTHDDLRQELILRLLQEQIAIDEKDSLYTGYMKVLDYLGLMSDNAAASLAKALSGLDIT
jgi:dGTPase